MGRKRKKKKVEDDFRTITVEVPRTTPPKPTVSFSKKSGLTVTSDLEKQAEYTQDDVKQFDLILDEESVEATQPFSDSTGGTVVLVDDSTDDSLDLVSVLSPPKKNINIKEDDKTPPDEPEPTVVVDAVEYAEKILQLKELIESVKELPEPILMPTQRQYGEEYLPTYIKVRAKQRRIAGLT